MTVLKKCSHEITDLFEIYRFCGIAWMIMEKYDLALFAFEKSLDHSGLKHIIELSASSIGTNDIKQHYAVDVELENFVKSLDDDDYLIYTSVIEVRLWMNLIYYYQYMVNNSGQINTVEEQNYINRLLIVNRVISDEVRRLSTVLTGFDEDYLNIEMVNRIINSYLDKIGVLSLASIRFMPNLYTVDDLDMEYSKRTHKS